MIDNNEGHLLIWTKTRDLSSYHDFEMFYKMSNVFEFKDKRPHIVTGREGGLACQVKFIRAQRKVHFAAVTKIRI